MAFQAVPGAWEVAVKGIENNGTIWANIYHLGFAPPSPSPTVDDANALYLLLIGCYTDSFLRNHMAAGWQIDRLIITRLDEITGPVVETTEANYAGISDGQYLPGQTALIINWLTGFRGRSSRGKTYLNGFTEISNDGRPDSACFDATVDFAGRWIDACESLAFDGGVTDGLIVVSRYEQNPAPPPSSIKRAHGVWASIENFNVSDKWATQRRRAIPV